VPAQSHTLDKAEILADVLKELQGVKRRLSALEVLLLPTGPAGPRGYNTQQSDRISTYVLLAHAELEGFLEFCALEAVEMIELAWASRVKMRALCTLVFFHHTSMEKRGDYEIDERSVPKALNFYRATVGMSHGIKTKNLYSLFLPLGFLHTDFDETWLATMNSFGSTRGDSAHNWVRTRLTIDPNDVRYNINKIIVPELRSIALRVKRLN
jgi:hypothetical protein